MFSLPSNAHLPSAQALDRRKVEGCFCSLQVGAAVQRWALSPRGVFSTEITQQSLEGGDPHLLHVCFRCRLRSWASLGIYTTAKSRHLHVLHLKMPFPAQPCPCPLDRPFANVLSLHLRWFDTKLLFLSDLLWVLICVFVAFCWWRKEMQISKLLHRVIRNNNGLSATKINDSINVKFDVKSPINSIPEGKNAFL